METAYFSSWIIQKWNQTENDTKQKGSSWEQSFLSDSPFLTKNENYNDDYISLHTNAR